MAAGLAGTALLYLVHQADPLEMFVTLMVSTAIGLLIPTILLPLSYKLGAERARQMGSTARITWMKVMIKL